MVGRSGEALLVAPHGALELTGGGVQVAVKDYLHLLELAGFKPAMVPFAPQRSLWNRFSVRLLPRVMSVDAPGPLTPDFDRDLTKREPISFFFAQTCFQMFLTSC